MDPESVVYAATLAGAAAVALAALGLAWPLGVDLWALAPANPARSLAVGALATAPLLAVLAVTLRERKGPLARFRESQLDYLGALGFRLTPARIVGIGLAAGVGEELLFRGVLQTALEAQAPTAMAVVLPNVLFGLLHARSALYAALAFAAGLWLGVVFAVSGDLLAPMTTHALYDAVALAVAARALSHGPAPGSD